MLMLQLKILNAQHAKCFFSNSATLRPPCICFVVQVTGAEVEGEGDPIEWSMEGFDLSGIDESLELDFDQLFVDDGEVAAEKGDVMDGVVQAGESAAADPEMVFLLIVVGLRLLFNTESGICGWAPVMFDNSSVVIVSLGMVEWFFGAASFLRNGTRYTVLFQHVLYFLKELPEVAVNWGGSCFYDAVMHTPFKPASIRSPTANSTRFLVTPLSGWINLVVKSKLDFTGVTLDPTFDLSIATVPRTIGQQFSFLPSSVTPGCLSFGQASHRLSADAKQCIPAFGVGWWIELFCPAMIECFELSSELVGRVHIVDCKVKHGVPVPDYLAVQQQERTAAKLREMLFA